MHRLGILTSATALLVAATAPVLWAVPASAAPSTPVVRVMPLGDSITYGQGSSNESGYRLPLHGLAAKQSRYQLDFVGSLEHGPMPDSAHEGHAGYTIARIRAGANRWLAAAQPDVVLLHIGINDLNQGTDPGQAADQASALVDQIFAARPGVTIVMEGLIPTTPGWNYQDLSQPVAQYNQRLKQLEQVEQHAGKRFRFVDAPALTPTDRADSTHPAQMSDGLHPNDAGYAQLAQAFFTPLDAAYSAHWFTGGPARPDQPRLKDTAHVQRIAPNGDLFNNEGDFAAGKWSGWSNQGASQLKEVTSTGTGSVNRVFAIGSDNKIYENDGDYTAGKWSGWFAPAINNSTTFTALAASSYGNTVHLVAIGSDGHLYNTDGDYTAGKWNGWSDQGGTNLKHVTSATTADQVNHIFATDATGQVLGLDADYAAGAWGSWSIAGPTGGFKALDVTASASGNTVHLGAISLAGQYCNTDGDFDRGGVWNGWSNMGGDNLKRLTSAAANGVNHVFATTGNNRLIERDGNYNTGTWNDWAEAAGGVDAASATASFTNFTN
ncbi:SGNH/GDSL hydrolase family protein [Streptomyces sp. NBC_00249]|uniref:GDSL-type esterase/lipase family protein n=1 Tax=Streptomyces sp. NBC_00249 TaxID=2975690 RepID=UPI002252922F|nr:GDSL-type esterase/lipase family protein [Streptomyces sp. NBC_00249]MCX5199279.1 SGNH/GDSL hydrolase family protein [Streptomyces sp. NBC_00249]